MALYAHVHQRGPRTSHPRTPGSRMPFKQWKALPPSARTAWDTLSDDDKAALLKVLLGGVHLNGNTQTDDSKMSVNVHSISNDDVVDAADGEQTTPSLAASLTSMVHENRASQNTSHPADIRRVLSQRGSTKPTTTNTSNTTTQANYVELNGDTYCIQKVNTHWIVNYSVERALRSASTTGSLVDRGANGGIAGNDVRVIAYHPDHRRVDIRGIDNHEITSIPIVTAGGLCQTQRGPVIAILHQYAYHPTQGKTIHSSGQLEHYHNDVNDRSIKVGGLQRIKTPDGYVFPLSIRDGLPYLPMQPYTDSEFCDPAIPHVILTGDLDWDPTVLDVDTFGDPTFYDAISDDVDRTQLFNVFGNYKYRHVATADTWYDSCTPDQSLRFDMDEMTYTCSEHSLYVSLADH
eukprot:scaffold8646_cov116-Cylindrotheca_fusiformis.AAC.1